MAAIENLEIIVGVDISSAIANLEDLQDELKDVSRAIRRASTNSGIDVSTRVESISDDLSLLKARLETFEATNSLDIDTNVNNLSAITGGGGGGLGIPQLRGVMRDAVADGMEMGANDASSNISDSVQDGFNRPFMEMGSLAWARRGQTASGMGMLFGDDDSSGISGGDGSGTRSFSRRVRDMASRLGGVMPNLDNFDLRMSDLHNMLARLVPLIFVFIGAIPAAIAGIYTLAAAAVAAGASLMALAGFGALGLAMEGGEFNAQNLSDAFDRVRQDFLDAFTPLANRLQPLFEDGLAGLETFFDEIAREGDALVALTDQARSFGRFVTEFVPEALRSIAALVAGFDNIFGNMGNFLNREFANVMQTIVEIALQAIPALAHLTLVIGRMLPTIVEISSGFLHMTAIIIRLLGAIGQIVGLLPISAEAFGLVTAAMLTAASAGLLLSSSLVSVGYSALVSAGRSIIQLLSIVASYIGVSGSAIASTLGLAASFRALAAAIALTGIGAIVVGLGFIASSALSAKSNIEGMTSALQDFQKIQSGMSGSGFGGGDSDPYGFNPDDPRQQGGTGGNVTVFNVESGNDANEDRSNLEYADWMSSRTTGG